MSTQTLAQAGLLINNEIVKGVVEDVIDLNPMFSMLPFDAFDGQSVVVNRELETAFDTGFSNVFAVGAAINAKDPMEFVTYNFSPTKIIGDAEIDDLVAATSSSAGVDQVAVEISSKSKGVGRRFQSGMANDNGVSPNMNSLHFLAGNAGYGNGVGYETTGTTLTLDKFDATFELVTAKQGQVDWAMLPPRTIRAYKALLRGLGGTPGDWVLDVPFADGRTRTVIAFEGTPVFRNDYLSVLEAAAGADLENGLLTSLWAGCWDDGSRRTGLAGIYPASVPAGIVVQNVGARETHDENIWRIKWYANLAMYNRRGLARGTDITD